MFQIEGKIADIEVVPNVGDVPPEPLLAAVMSPLPFTVMFAFVKEPTFELTVAKVPAAVTLLEPSKLGDV